MTEEERWLKVEEIVRRVIKEEIAQLGKKPKIDLVNGRWVGVNEETMNAWGAAYAALDLKAELARAAAWILSNPNLAPKNQFGRFLNTWFTRSQNQASLRSIPTSKPQGPAMKLCAYCDVAVVASGQVSGIWACDAHWRKALDHDPVPRMRGVVAKPVAGS